MRLNEWICAIEQIAPLELALDFDNSGLLITPKNKEIKKVLVALDCTVETAKEAVSQSVDLMLTHHPMFFHSVKHILEDDPETAPAWYLMQNGIGLYAAHTNWDAASGGVNDILLEKLGVRDIMPLPPENLGRIGTLPISMQLKDFASVVETRLRTKADIAGDPEKMISRVACVGGSGEGEYKDAKDAGADVFVTGELKHHEGIYANAIEIPLIVAGHYATEYPSIQPLVERLQHITNDVKYTLAFSDKGPFWHR